jgi:hypothetical protein
VRNAPDREISEARKDSCQIVADTDFQPTAAFNDAFTALYWFWYFFRSTLVEDALCYTTRYIETMEMELLPMFPKTPG